MQGAAHPPALKAKQTNLPFTLNNYTFTTLIGKGGFAEVYRVTHNQFHREYVAKVMTIDQSSEKSSWKIFESEVETLSDLDHPNIVRLYDHFRIGDQVYLILQYCPSGSLYDEIKKTHGLTLERFVEVGRQIVSALVHCHDKGVAHRDIKPGNILIDEFGGVKLADFGLSLRTVAGQKHRRFGGSFVFTAPEIFQKQLHDPMAGDVWALGVVFAMMATGKSPWPCDSVGGLKKLVSLGNYQLRKPVPDSIANLIGKMLVVDPSKRMTMKQVAAHPVFARVIGVSPRVSRSFRVTRPGFAWQGMVRSSSQMFQGMDLSTESSDALEERRDLQTGRVHAISCAILNKRPHVGVKQRMNTTHLQASVFHTFPEDDVEEF